MERFINVAGAQMGPIAREEFAPASGVAAPRNDARGQGPRRRYRGVPGAGAHHLLSALVDGRRRRDRQLLRARDAQSRRRGRCSTRRNRSASASISGTPNWRKTTASRTATTPRSWWTRTPRSSASTAKCICRATPTTGRITRISISKSATSSRAIWDFRCGPRSAPMWGCASATIAAGRRPTA